MGRRGHAHPQLCPTHRGPAGAHLLHRPLHPQALRPRQPLRHRYRTGAPWRDVPERFGNWNTIYKNFNRWSEQGVWARVLEKVQSLTHQRGELDWVASIDSTIVRVHQHGATLRRDTGGSIELQEVRGGAA